MPYEDRYQDHNENDNHDAYGSRAAPTAIVDYNRAISHTSHCSFRSSQSARFIPRVQASVPGGGEASGMWVWFGCVLSLVLAAVAWSRSRAPLQSYYEGEVYGLNARTHRCWAGLFILLALAAALTAVWAPVAGEIPLLSALALAGILYASGFLRGATGEDE
jgi:hypothetical protein